MQKNEEKRMKVEFDFRKSQKQSAVEKATTLVGYVGFTNGKYFQHRQKTLVSELESLIMMNIFPTMNSLPHSHSFLNVIYSIDVILAH